MCVRSSASPLKASYIGKYSFERFGPVWKMLYIAHPGGWRQRVRRSESSSRTACECVRAKHSKAVPVAGSFLCREPSSCQEWCRDRQAHTHASVLPVPQQLGFPNAACGKQPADKHNADDTSPVPFTTCLLACIIGVEKITEHMCVCRRDRAITSWRAPANGSIQRLSPPSPSFSEKSGCTDSDEHTLLHGMDGSAAEISTPRLSKKLSEVSFASQAMHLSISRSIHQVLQEPSRGELPATQ